MTRGTGQEEKAKAAAVFYAAWKKAEQNETYAGTKSDWKKMRG